MKRIILLFFLLFNIVLQGQRKYAADRYFKEFAYKKSAALYKRLYDKGDTSYLVLSRLGDSYYYTASYEKAEEVYEELTTIYKGTITSEHLFKYAQVLKINGKVKDSDTWLLKLKEVNSNDSRVLDLVSNKDYFITYTNMPKTYVHIHNISVNSKYSDFSGFLRENDFYFWSTRPNGKNDELYSWNNQPYLNIYKSKQMSTDEAEAVDVDDTEKVVSINSKYHDSNLVITKDGETAYFTRANHRNGMSGVDKQGTAHLKLLKAKKSQDGWGDIKEVPFNNKSYSVGHPALSADEKTLFFVSDKPGGYGGTDLYKVSIEENGSFGKPENLGPRINTEGREMFPFLINEKLFFASDGHIGLGALDIFESKLEGEEYGDPVNLGSPVNSSLDDFGFILNKEGTAGYFSSNRKGGKGDDDIYSFKIYHCKGGINGIVSNTRTGAPIGNVTVRLLNKKGEPVSEQKTQEDGSYAFAEVDCEKDFIVVASKDDYKSAQNNLTMADIDKEKLQSNLTIEPLIIESQIVINPIFFDYNSYQVREDATYELENVVSVMNSHQNMIIKIESHTDNRGSDKYNKKLSDQRAKATKDYIISRGIAPNRIESAKGYGESQPVKDCSKQKCTETDHQENRRSYFYIVKK